MPDVVTARAFAPLEELLNLIHKNVSRETILLLPKGKNVLQEFGPLSKLWQIEQIQNCINPEGCILKMKGADK